MTQTMRRTITMVYEYRFQYEHYCYLFIIEIFNFIVNNINNSILIYYHLILIVIH